MGIRLPCMGGCALLDRACRQLGQAVKCDTGEHAEPVGWEDCSPYVSKCRLMFAGVGADPSADGEPPSEDVVAPAYPKYEGLAYKSAAQKPDEAADLQFPPASAAKPAVVAMVSVEAA